MRPSNDLPHGPGERARLYWCALCDTFCASSDELKAHYHELHPAVAAQLDALAARQARKAEERQRREHLAGG